MSKRVHEHGALCTCSSVWRWVGGCFCNRQVHAGSRVRKGAAWPATRSTRGQMYAATAPSLDTPKSLAATGFSLMPGRSRTDAKVSAISAAVSTCGPETSYALPSWPTPWTAATLHAPNMQPHVGDVSGVGVGGVCVRACAGLNAEAARGMPYSTSRSLTNHHHHGARQVHPTRTCMLHPSRQHHPSPPPPTREVCVCVCVCGGGGLGARYLGCTR